MFEMQGIRMMHCTIWTEGVREIVSAEDANVKFLVSDHPITIYNYAATPEAQACAYPNDPTIAHFFLFRPFLCSRFFLRA